MKSILIAILMLGLCGAVAAQRRTPVQGQAGGRMGGRMKALTPKATTHDGQPALQFEGEEGWSFFVSYFMRQGEPALGFTVAQDQCPGRLYVTRSRISGDFRNTSCQSFDLPHSGATAQRAMGKVKLQAGSATYELSPQAERGTERHNAPAMSPAGEFMLRSIDNFDRTFANVRRMAMEAQGQTPQPGAKPGSVSLAEAAKAAQAKRAPGTLTLTSDPGDVQVYVNDEPHGLTSSEGREVLQLAPGAYRVRLSLPGYKDFEQQVTMAAGKNQDVSARLEPVGPPPFTANDVAEMLEGKMSAKRVTTLVQERGVDFELNPDLEKRLRGLGATSDLLLAIATNKKK